MDQPDGLDPARYCSFCQSTFPEIGELFAAPDGLSICDGCVAFLWETLQAQREAEAVRSSLQSAGSPAVRRHDRAP